MRTPGPWKADDVKVYSEYKPSSQKAQRHISQWGLDICLCEPQFSPDGKSAPIGDEKGNAAFIVRAVNNFDELLEALKDFRSFEYRRGVNCQKSIVKRCLCEKCIEERADSIIRKAEEGL